MPFNYLLTNLLVDVPSALGAIFVDAEGEAIDWVSRQGDPFGLKVAGAYHTIFDRKLTHIAERLAVGAVYAYTVAGKDLSALTHVLPGNYYVVLVIERGSLHAVAMYHLRRAAQVLTRELA